ncbi:MAG: T9SS type A sorting domain-containing protein [Cyclobacteriaceae bacterium]
MKYTKLIILTFLIAFASLSNGFAQEVSLENRLNNPTLTVKTNVEVYPNPAVEFLIVQISDSSLENVEFEMYSLIGNKVKIQPEQIGNDKYKISVKDFSSGYYFLRITDEKTRFEKAKKFLKN